MKRQGKKELDRIVSAAVGKLSMDRDGIVVMNTQGYERDDVVTVYGEEALPALEDEQGRNVPLQRMADGSYLLYAEHVPPLGYRKLYAAGQQKSEKKRKKPGTAPLRILFSVSVLMIGWKSHLSMKRRQTKS